MIVWSNRIHCFKYINSTTLGCKDIGIKDIGIKDIGIKDIGIKDFENIFEGKEDLYYSTIYLLYLEE